MKVDMQVRWQYGQNSFTIGVLIIMPSKYSQLQTGKYRSKQFLFSASGG